jgi:isoleucyl-tRNA synthetase
MWNLFKKRNRDIIINNKDKLSQILTKTVEILRDNAYSAQADAIRKPLQCLYLDDTENFIKYLNTVDIWGGSGAAWEVRLEPEEVKNEFMQCIVDLVEELNKTGIKIPRERGIAKLFKRELEKV